MNSGATSTRLMWPHARSKAAGARTAPVQSTSLGPSAVMITLPGWRSAWHSPSSGRTRSIRVRMPAATRFGHCRQRAATQPTSHAGRVRPAAGASCERTCRGTRGSRPFVQATWPAARELHPRASRQQAQNGRCGYDRRPTVWGDDRSRSYRQARARAFSHRNSGTRRSCLPPCSGTGSRRDVIASPAPSKAAT